MQKKRFTYSHKGKIIEYDIWFTGSDEQLSTIIFLGTVQVGDIPRWVAEACPPGTVVVQGAPHWLAEADGSDIPDFMLHFSNSAFDSIKREYDIHGTKIIADSQSAPSVLRVINNNNLVDTISALVLLQPLGLNIQAYSGDESTRLRVFKRRLAKNALNHLAPLTFDERLRYSYQQQLQLKYSDNDKADAQYAAGLAYDALDDLERVYASGIKVSIVCGSQDRLFPPDEVSRNLQSAGLPIEVIDVPGVSHTPLPSKHGLRLLRVALS